MVMYPHLLSTFGDGSGFRVSYGAIDTKNFCICGTGIHRNLCLYCTGTLRILCICILLCVLFQ